MSKPTSATRRKRPFRRLTRCRRGAVAIEFAFILPGLVLLTLGLLELTLILFDFHRFNEASRAGLRTALIEAPVASLDNLDSDNTITCTGSGAGVSCSGGPVGSASSWDTIVARVQRTAVNVEASNLRLSYTESGVIDPSEVPGTVTPTVTLSLVDLEHDFFFLDFIPGIPSSFTYPDITTTALGPTDVIPP